MSGRFMRLRPGHYMLNVPRGYGPAGVHRAQGEDVQVDRHGGQAAFEVPAEQRVYFWWRGPLEPTGLRLVGPGSGGRRGRTRAS